ncbi:tryptophan ABC transporter substrate-binding protein [Aerococcus sp. 1KP-2016]|uniref:tryptophan ABC transporter substrate-binding protein n=1 Tax=Aerococcus sp. 1KP-2016 TaxID=1981982 RepID=UPI000B98C668|nr:tryptophan ABC transporter substrate-binding protein [Aerococcus sp. 1KP-2016]OYQ66748.1 ABC transporter substrate-binding protein [Aerococcus sp. 1KP-2016]
MKKISGLGAILVIALFSIYLAMPSLIARRDAENTANEKVSETKLVETDDDILIGLLQFIQHPSLDLINQGIYDGLAERGYVDGENITIDYQNGQGNQSDLAMIADSFIAEDADILVGIATPAAQALANAANGDRPVILSAVSNPVGAGFVASDEEPGANVTGVTDLAPVDKQFDLMQTLLPGVQKVGIIYNSSETNVTTTVEAAKAEAEARDLEVVELTITSTNDLASVAEQLAGQVDAIFVPNDNTIASAMDTLIQVTDSHQIPVIPVVDAMVADGGLATVGINQYQFGILTAKVIADVIEGADTATYPIIYNEATDTFINTEKAAELGIEIPQEILDSAIDVNSDEYAELVGA